MERRMRKFARLGVILGILIILGLFLPHWHIAIGSPDVETIRPTNYYDVVYATTNPTQAYDGNTTTSGNTRFTSNNDPSINYGQDDHNIDAWQNKSQTWNSAILYATIERELATDDTAGVYIINSTGTEKHTLLAMGSSAFSKQEVSQTLNSADWGGSGFPDIYDLRVKVKTTKSGGPDNKYLKIYEIRIEGSYNPPPTVGTITISPSSMTPQQQWTNITVPVTDNNTLADVNKVNVTVFYDSAGNNPPAPGTANVSTCAILTWTRGGSPVWSLAPASTTWAINTAGCSNASDSLTTGNWVFSFKVGKVATHSPGSDNWDIYAKATDSISQTGNNYLRDVEMNWYGEITVGTSTVSWGTVTPGCSNNISPVVNITYICNGNYNEQIKTSQNWTSALGNVTLNTTGTPGIGEFSLKADDDDTIADAVQVLSASYTTFDSGTQTTESGSAENNNHLWLSLGLGIRVDTYSGTIYFGIAQ
jgi:hypothetical protein